MAAALLGAVAGHARYQPVAVLGQGASGFVLAAHDTACGGIVAIKLIDRSRVLNKRLQREITHHRSLLHPHIIRFFEVFITEHHVAVVIEHANGGTLRSYIQRHGKLQESAARWFFQQLVLAVDFCHRKGVINRDLKSDNTLLQWQEGLPEESGGIPTALLKICDFGYSKSADESEPTSRVGSIMYMAPEVILKSTAAAYDGKLADVWSCGVMLFEMLFGRFPFYDPARHADLKSASEIRALLDRIMSLDWNVPDGCAVSGPCMEVLRCTIVGAESRASIQQLQQLPWFRMNLAPGAEMMNDLLVDLELPAATQPIEDINNLLSMG